MAEWSKALDLSSSILRMHEFEPRRRQSLLSESRSRAAGGSGSRYLKLGVRVAGQVGFDGLVGYDDRLTRGRCRVRSSVEVPF